MSTSLSPIAAAGASTDSANHSQTKRAKPTPRYSLEAQQSRLAELEARASRVDDATVKQDLASSEAAFSAATEAASRAMMAKQKLFLAKQALGPSTQALNEAFQVVEGVLRPRFGGKAFLAACKTRNRLDNAQNILDRLPEDRKGVPLQLLSSLEEALAHARWIEGERRSRIDRGVIARRTVRLQRTPVWASEEPS